MFSFSLELLPFLDGVFEQFFSQLSTDSEVKSFQSFCVEIDRKEQQMYQKYAEIFMATHKKVESTYNLAVRALRSMPSKTWSRNPIL